MDNEKEFVDGLFVKEPKEGAPDWVKAKISMKRKELGRWLQQKDNDWINIDVKVSKGGKWYCEVDNWVPTAGKSGNQFDQFGDDDTVF